ncbi:hypothetical protein ACL1HS_03630 [Corynebacterium striatum]|uniref:hypothetical protein n=1 Tax=Corynebacterium striatum TaxID=43770 RepID=UPI001419EEF2|nr:hypothetical protein [Corynebacterium striatum]NHY10545.1 hypothetical protein [Corynebacterium striatum]NHY36198.1 hypothetical protein [Corynebacterium striatum]HAT1131150.1 hypothetical protein [Corynebacterium striatum]HAT1139435.1 hypothetical protein [Corynebacterium striatum]HAT1141770.1 hypothetical protein [Corynebacterium striatum]
MKFFSRKALVAAAAAATISFGGAGAAMAQDAVQPEQVAATTTPSSTKAPEGNKLSSELSSSNSNGKDSGDKAKQIKDWIGVFTAVISALGALFAFANKYLKF